MSKKQTICRLGITIFIYLKKKSIQNLRTKAATGFKLGMYGSQDVSHSMIIFYSILMEDYNSYSAIVKVDNHILYPVSYPVKKDIFILYHLYLRTEKPHNFR